MRASESPAGQSAKVAAAGRTKETVSRESEGRGRDVAGWEGYEAGPSRGRARRPRVQPSLTRCRLAPGPADGGASLRQGRDPAGSRLPPGALAGSPGRAPGSLCSAAAHQRERDCWEL